MHLTDSEIEFFDKKALRLPSEKREEYIRQVDYLIDSLKAKSIEDGTLGIEKFLKAGSLRKGTVLRPRDGYGVDADIAVYLIDDDAQFDLDNLHDRIRRLLIAIYPQKKPEDFPLQPRTLGIEFLTSGLNVDLVPVLSIDGSYGWQPSAIGSPPIKTSIPGQLEFLRNRANQDRRFRLLVRVLKRWRNQQELDDALRSFVIELLLAHIQDVQGPTESLEAGILRFFLFVAQHELSTPISFPENGQIDSYPTDPVVVLDPVNSDNNATKRVKEFERIEIVEKATEAWEFLTTARRNNFKGETLDCWKEVFGRSFVIEE